MRCIFHSNSKSALRFFLVAVLFLIVACARQTDAPALSRASDRTAGKILGEACPNIFVAESFASKTIVDEIRETSYNLSFEKVTARCKLDKHGMLLLDLSFIFLLTPDLPKQIRSQKFLLPLFAVASEDDQTVSSRMDQVLLVRFNASGRANARWLLALPTTFTEQTSSRGFSGSSSRVRGVLLYLGFGGDAKFSLRGLSSEKR